MDEGQSSTPPQATGGNKNMLLLGLVVLVVIGVLGLVVLFVKPKTATAPATTTQEQATPSPEGVQINITEEAPEDAMMTGKEVTVNVEATSFKFTPAEIRVKKGDTVKIVLTNKTGMHDFVLDEFDVKSKTLTAGQSEVVTFVADEAGTFEYYCSIGNHRQMGMVGNLIVE